MKKVLFFFLFLFVFTQQMNSAVEDVVLSLDATDETVVDSNGLEVAANQSLTEEDDDDDFITITDLLVNAYATIDHAVREGIDTIVSPLVSGKKYIVTSLKNEFGQEKYHAHLAPAAVVLGAKNIQMLFAFATHILLQNKNPEITKLQVAGYSVPLQELYEQMYQLETKDVLSYEHKTVAEKIAKIVPEVAIIVLWHALAEGIIIEQEFKIRNAKFTVADNMNLLLQGQLANTLDGSIDEFLSLETDQIVFGASKALLRGAIVFARADVQAAQFELNNAHLKQAGAEALLPIIIDGCVNKIPLGLTKMNKKRVECIMHWISKTILRQLLFPQK